MSVVHSALDEHIAAFSKLREQSPLIEEIARRMRDSLSEGAKILWMGNGGSAADSQHLAAELVGRYRKEREAMASIALTTDTSILTAVGNDYGYDQVFRRQILALCRTGDVVVGLSTSGNSRSVLLALEAARDLGAVTVGFTGQDGGKMSPLCDLCLHAPSDNTARIQEMHIAVGHILCELLEGDS